MAQGSTIPDFETLVLGDNREEFPVDDPATVREALVSMIRQIRHRLDLFTYQLDPPILDDPEVTDALRRLVVDRRHLRIRFMAHDLGPVIAHGHRLIEMAQRLSTFVEIRTVAEEHRENISAFVVADGAGVIFRKHADSYDGTVCFNAPRRADELGRQFEEMWAHGQPDPNLRALSI